MVRQDTRSRFKRIISSVHGSSRAPQWIRTNSFLAGLAAAGTVLAVSAVANVYLAKRAERANPPVGRFLHVDGVWLHYIDRGAGTPLVFLHGNGGMIQDFESSGLIELAAQNYRVIVFDRPGFGHSSRPRSTVWTAEAQANLIHAALTQIGVSRAIVLGHSWGASVAMALALLYPRFVIGLVLASGYYFPTPRLDVVMVSGIAVPILGDTVRYTIAPIISRLMMPFFLRKIFGPAPIPEKFKGFPREMAVRPSQISAEAEESGLLIQGAATASTHYGKLKMPVAIIVGSRDRLIDPEGHSGRLHKVVAHSTLHSLVGSGHMVHQTDTVAVMSAIDEVASGLQDQKSCLC